MVCGEGAVMGQMQREKRIRRELGGKARWKVFRFEMRRIARAVHRPNYVLTYDLPRNLFTVDEIARIWGVPLSF